MHTQNICFLVYSQLIDQMGKQAGFCHCVWFIYIYESLHGNDQNARSTYLTFVFFSSSSRDEIANLPSPSHQDGLDRIGMHSALTKVRWVGTQQSKAIAKARARGQMLSLASQPLSLPSSRRRIAENILNTASFFSLSLGFFSVSSIKELRRLLSIFALHLILIGRKMCGSACSSTDKRDAISGLEITPPCADPKKELGSPTTGSN